MKLGIRAHDMGMKNNPRQVAAAARELGFEAVQLVLHKAIANARHLPGELDEGYCREVKKCLCSGRAGDCPAWSVLQLVS